MGTAQRALLAPVQALRQWPARRWLFAAAAAVVTVLVVGVPTAVIPTPVFSRMVPPMWWTWPVLAITGVLGGLVAATYFRSTDRDPRASRSSTAGGVLSWLAVGCPVCNKLVLLTVGASGAMQLWAPIQPLVAVASVLLLGYALHRRLRGEIYCPVRRPEPATGS